VGNGLRPETRFGTHQAAHLLHQCQSVLSTLYGYTATGVEGLSVRKRTARHYSFYRHGGRAGSLGRSHSKFGRYRELGVAEAVVSASEIILFGWTSDGHNWSFRFDPPSFQFIFDKATSQTTTKLLKPSCRHFMFSKFLWFDTPVGDQSR
jgi:hypothetical protein